MKILITGGIGYIGYSIVKTFLSSMKELEEIVIYDNLSNNNYTFFFNGGFPPEKLKFVNGDILDRRKLIRALENIDVVIHAAGYVSTPFSDIDSHRFEQINHWGTASLMDAIEHSKITKFIYLSSLSVYGVNSGWVDEENSPNPSTFYGLSKLRGEHQVKRLANTDIKYYILRVANVYGYNPCLRIKSLINKFAFNAHFFKKNTVFGDGEQHRAFIYVEDFAKIVLSILQKEPKEGTYNVAAFNASVLEIAEAISRVFTETDLIFVNQHIKMKDFKVMLPTKIDQQIDVTHSEFENNLRLFKKQFSF